MSKVIQERKRILLYGPCLIEAGAPEPEPEYGYIGAVVVPDDWMPPVEIEDAVEFING